MLLQSQAGCGAGAVQNCLKAAAAPRLQQAVFAQEYALGPRVVRQPSSFSREAGNSDLYMKFPGEVHSKLKTKPLWAINLQPAFNLGTHLSSLEPRMFQI